MRFRSTFCLIILLLCLVFSQSPALAENSINSSGKQLSKEAAFSLDALDNVVKVVQQSLKSFYQEFTGNLKTADSDIRKKNQALRISIASENRAIKSQNTKLKKAEEQAFKANSRLLTNPELINASSLMFNLGQYFREQAGLRYGNETLSAGPNSEYSQKRKEALSLMIAELKAEVQSDKSLIYESYKAIRQVKDNLLAVSKNGNADNSELGLDYFLSRQLALLGSQFDLLSDFAIMNSGYNLEGYRELTHLICQGTQTRFKSLNEHAFRLSDYASSWTGLTNSQIDYKVSDWRSTRTSDYPDADLSPEDLKGLFNGFQNSTKIFQPGIIEQWNACIFTKSNIIKDLQSQVSLEISRGNLSAARQIGLLENKYALEIKILESQKVNLENIQQRLAKLTDIAEKNSFPLPGSVQLTSPAWKISLYSQAKNMERLSQVKKSILLAARKVIELAISEVAKIDPALAKDQQKTVLAAVARRLAMIGDQGFGSIDQELSAYASSLAAMSMNISSAEKSLEEAINVFENVISLRNSQRIKDATDKFLKDKQAADEHLNRVEREKLNSANLIKSAEQKKVYLTNIDQSLNNLHNSFKSFFSTKYSHPVIAMISEQFLRDLQLPGQINREVLKALSANLQKVKTLTIPNNRPSKYCLGKNSPACASVKKSSLGKKISKKRKSFLKKVPQLTAISASAGQSLDLLRQQLQSLRSQLAGL